MSNDFLSGLGNGFLSGLGNGLKKFVRSEEIFRVFLIYLMYGLSAYEESP